MDFDLEYLEKLARIAHKNGLEEITLEDDNRLISLRRGKIQTGAAPSVQIQSAQQSVISAAEEPAEKKSASVHKGRPITAPMAGTFYSSPAPGEEPFVKEGDNIAAGQVVCIIEAMKLMNEIESEVSGRITEICIKDGEAAEPGQVLMYAE